MNNQNNFLMNISVLYRYTQKFFDKNLEQYGIGAGQIIFLLLINENEGITMQQLAILGDFDKVTTTKAIQKLEDQGYIEQIVDINDKRVRKLYTTKKCSDIINDIYQIRNNCLSQVSKGVKNEEEYLEVIQQLAINAKDFVREENDINQIKIFGIQKLTLLDYPGEVACTIFTAGCNMKCPFCHNRDLVFIPENYDFIDQDSIIDFLAERKGKLDAVCISGGEPTLQKGLLPFIKEIKELGYKVKLDTNGYNFESLKEIVESGYIDYVAMDIKNSASKYAKTIGLETLSFKIDSVQKSVQYLLENHVEYEFRTTVVKQLHTLQDLLEIAEWIKGAKHYYLQQFVDSGNCIEEGYSAYDATSMNDMYEQVKKIIPTVELRGTM